MANRQQKLFRKKGLKTINNGASTVVSNIEHGKYANQPPDVAIRRLRESGSNSWKVTGRHPANSRKNARK